MVKAIVCHPTPEILGKVAKGTLKVALSYKKKKNNHEDLFPAQLYLPTTIQDVCKTLNVEDDCRIVIGPKFIVKTDGVVSNCSYMTLTDFIDRPKSICNVIRDIRKDNMLLQLFRSEGEHVHFDAVADLYLYQPHILYAYLLIRNCNGGVNKGLVTIECQKVSKCVSETNISLRKDILCGVCCNKLCQPQVDVNICNDHRIELKSTVTSMWDETKTSVESIFKDFIVTKLINHPST